jgi:ComF family protein
MKNLILDAIYPLPCQGCGSPQPINTTICHWCKTMLPCVETTQTFLFNRLSQIMPIQGAFSFLYFQKHELTQSLLHKLKYKNKPEIGLELGRLMASQFQDIGLEAVVPVPLHPKKQAKRGYNQAERLAKGISEVLQIPADEDVVKRIKFTKTQAQLSQEQRAANVKDAFEANPNTKLQKVLLVDDVVTTGATLAACAQSLHSAGVGKIWVAVVADASI